MLTVYSIQGSPGASTAAMHLAAHWASEGREILLIEADPAGGSLSHNLGIQFTPGSASFVASGLPVHSNHLIDHAQDVLFENLHVMPAPASPTGARGIFNTFADFSEELRTISEHEMAVIIDGGRITTDTAASGLTTGAAGVVVVCRNNSQLSSLEHLKDMLAAGLGEGGPQGCAVTVGKSPLSPEEWQENCGLTFCGSIDLVADMAPDLSAYLARSKRKSKKWRASLDQVGEKLYPYARPPESNRPRRPAAAAARPGTEVGGDAGQATPAAATFDPAAQDPAGYGLVPPMAQPEGFPAYGQAPPMSPAPQPGHEQSHYLPPTGSPADPQSPSRPGYGEAPPTPPEGFPAYGQPAPPLNPPAQYPSQPYEQQPPYPPQPGTHEQPAAHEQQAATYEQQPPYPPQPGTHEQPAAYEQQAATYEQQPPYPPQPGTHEQPAAHEQQAATYEQQPPYPPQPGTHEQPAAYEQQAATYEQQPPYPPQPGTHEQPAAYEQQAATYEQQPPYPPQPGTHEQPAAYEQQPQYPAQPGTYEQQPQYPPQPGTYEQPAAHPQPPQTESPPRPRMKPTGSFRDWAVKLHGSNAADTTAHRGG